MGAAPKYTQQRDAKLLQMKALSYSYVKRSSRVPLLLLTVRKIESENFDFVLVIILLFLLFLLLLLVPSSSSLFFLLAHT